MKIAITGTRDVTPEGRKKIEDALAEIITSRDDIEAIIFGGARGTDTIALEIAHKIRQDTNKVFELVVVVPFKINKQPREAREAIEKYADRLIELDQPFSMGGYLKRNQEMVRMADLVLAFSDKRDGGTTHTIDIARKFRKEIKVFEL